MRKIEEEMLNAIEYGLNWCKDNTMVSQSGGKAYVYLFGKRIAHYDYYEKALVPDRQTLANWPTNTTKSRLRALGVDVYTKNHITYLNGVEV